ncbi:putative monocarboxylate transporter mch1 [Mycoblastus sanguinarius]|nr:putative monocarboxylate transporter mch1 [Mycoblastus sanguinarius]
MPSRPSNPGADGTHISKLDFDSHRKPRTPATSHDSSASDPNGGGLLRDDESFFSNIVDGVIQRDRRKMRRAILKYVSFASAILSSLCAGSITVYSLYGPLFLKHLRYSQYQVNAVSTTAELAMYLPVPLFGYLCDRYNPRPVSLAAGVLFGVGYLLAALTYRAGPERSGGWPFAVMVLAFVGVGMGTSGMYLSAVTTCAKNFGRGKHKGLALAMPIAAFGLSGVWESQVGSHQFSPRNRDGGRGDMDAFRYFLFLAGLLFAVGLIGAVALRVVNEEELIDEAVDELERSGLLEDSPLFQRSVLHDNDPPHAHANNYGTLHSSNQPDNNSTTSRTQDPTSALKKTRLLNTETRLFLTDPTMWLLALGFFLTTGPGEAFINNLGTIIHTLYPPSPISKNSPIPPSNSPATHVSIVASTSTLARLLMGTLSDVLAPIASTEAHFQKLTCTISRMTFLLIFTLLSSLGQLLLATGAIQSSPTLFPLVSALLGLGYGAIFSLCPIIVSVVWGVENFGTNWGIVAVVPAAGAAIWGAIYSAVYQAGVEKSQIFGQEEQQMCYGVLCYQSTFWGMAVASWVAMGLWFWAWRGWKGRGVAV